MAAAMYATCTPSDMISNSKTVETILSSYSTLLKRKLSARPASGSSDDSLCGVPWPIYSSRPELIRFTRSRRRTRPSRATTLSLETRLSLQQRDVIVYYSKMRVIVIMHQFLSAHAVSKIVSERYIVVSPLFYVSPNVILSQHAIKPARILDGVRSHSYVVDEGQVAAAMALRSARHVDC